MRLFDGREGQPPRRGHCQFAAVHGDDAGIILGRPHPHGRLRSVACHDLPLATILALSMAGLIPMAGCNPPPAMIRCRP